MLRSNNASAVFSAVWPMKIFLLGVLNRNVKKTGIKRSIVKFALDQNPRLIVKISAEEGISHVAVN